MSFLDELDAKVKAQGGLIVSCQPVPGSPLDKPDIIAAMALAAEQAWRCVSKVLRTCEPSAPW